MAIVISGDRGGKQLDRSGLVKASGRDVKVTLSGSTRTLDVVKNMNFEIRKYSDSDLGDLVNLMAQLGYQHTERSLSENIGAVRESGGEIFVADSRGKVYGCICAIFDIRLAAGINGEIVSLVVDSSARGMGVGKGLVAKAESWLRQRTNRLRVRANSVRTEAHDFYKDLGYSLSKTQAVFTKNV